MLLLLVVRVYLGNVGLEELEGLGRECDLPRKRTAVLFIVVSLHICFEQEDSSLWGVGILLSGKRRRVSLHFHRGFPEKGVE